MNICEFVTNQPSSVVAGILTASGYALREEISLFSALEEMGFTDVDTDQLQDVTSLTELGFLAIFCASQIVLKNSDLFN